MALISCPECSREISDKAASCPYCGVPLIQKPKYEYELLPDTVTCLGCKNDVPLFNEVCPHCGLFNSQRYKLLLNESEPELESESQINSSTPIYCPKCGAKNAFSARDKGFSLAKAAIGSLIGPAGLLGGLIGSKKTVITCLKCNHKWRPGE